MHRIRLAYLGLTATRMNAADAIHVGFADMFVPEQDWPALIATLEESGDPDQIRAAAGSPEAGALNGSAADTARLFHGATLTDIQAALQADGSDFAAAALKKMSRNSPLSMAVFVEMMQRLRGRHIEDALELEYCFVSRSMEHGDFLEGIRAAIIDKDRNPKWQHQWPDPVPDADVSRMLGATDFSLPRP